MQACLKLEVQTKSLNRSNARFEKFFCASIFSFIVTFAEKTFISLLESNEFVKRHKYQLEKSYHLIALIYESVL